MKRKLFSVGNSVAAAIPTYFLEVLELKVGDYINIKVDSNNIIISKIDNNN